MKAIILKSMMAVLVALCSINANAYDACIDGIYYNLVKKTKTAEVTYGESQYATYSGEVVIPASVEQDGVTYSVTSIGTVAFDNCHNLTSVTIPSSIISIGNSAFFKCKGLLSLTIPNSVKSIGGYAFCECSSLTSLIIPNSVTSIGNRAFAGCSRLTSMTIPNSITSIEERTFCYCI